MGYDRDRDRDWNRHYYEFRTIGRELTHDEMKIMKLFTGWAKVGPDRLVYNAMCGGEPQLDADKLLTFCFDVAITFERQGHRSMAFRLPRDLERGVKPYIGEELYVESWVSKENLFVKFMRDDEDTWFADEQPETWLDEFLPLRDMMMAGDLSPVYAASELEGDTYPQPPKAIDLDGLEEVGDWSPPRLALDKWLWIDSVLDNEKAREAWMRLPR